MVNGNTSFAIDLYRHLSQENPEENLFFSPYSISSAMIMTAEGARGETAMELGDVLQFPKPARNAGQPSDQPWKMALIHEAMKSINDGLLQRDNKEFAEAEQLVKRIKKIIGQLDKFKNTTRMKSQLSQLQATASKHSKPYELLIANGLFAEKSYPFDDAYFDTINRYYDTGGVFSSDFKNASDLERQKINDWASEQTKDRIKEICPPDSITYLTRLVLVNAIYFKGDWAVPFLEEDTHDRDFFKIDGSTIKKPIMSRRNAKNIRYGNFNVDKGFELAEIPYKGDTLSMVVILPNDPSKLQAVEKMLSWQSLNQWIARTQLKKIHILLPKFKVEGGYTLAEPEKVSTLQRMGINRAFNDPRDKSNGAQFDGMLVRNPQEEKPYISHVLHKSFVEVNENGTEAAAVTAVSTAIPVSVPQPVPIFNANRPFIYLIRDRNTGCILFMGRMLEP